MNKREKHRLNKAFDLLLAATGDTDPETEGMTRDEIEDVFPVFLAAKIICALLHPNPRSKKE